MPSNLLAVATAPSNKHFCKFMVEIKENFHKETPESENKISLEEVRLRNNFHKQFDVAQRNGFLDEIDKLQCEYVKEFGAEKLAAKLRVGVYNEQEIEAAKSNVGLLNDYLDSLPKEQRREWLSAFQRLSNKGAIEGVLTSFKPACYIKEEDADFILTAMKGKDILHKGFADKEGFCFLYSFDNVAQTIRKNLDVFVDLLPGPPEGALTKEVIENIFERLSVHGGGYFNDLRVGTILGYHRPDVEMFSKYRDIMDRWTKANIFEESPIFTSSERTWLKLFSAIANYQPDLCPALVDKIVGENVWPEAFVKEDRAKMVDLLGKIKQSVEQGTYPDSYLQFAHTLHPFIYQQILRETEMSSFLSSYFLSKRRIIINGVAHFSYGYNEAHKAIAAKAEKLLRESGLKNLIEQKPLARQ